MDISRCSPLPIMARGVPVGTSLYAVQIFKVNSLSFSLILISSFSLIPSFSRSFCEMFVVMFPKSSMWIISLMILSFSMWGFMNSGMVGFSISGPNSDGGTPRARWAAAGLNMSLPWKVLETFLSIYFGFVILYVWVIPSFLAAIVSSPLSGPTYMLLFVSMIIGFLSVPTPGSTTATCTVPFGK